MAIRRGLLMLAVPLAALSWGTACSETARHRALSFFFDGVPEPGTVPPKGYAVRAGRARHPDGGRPGAPVVAARIIHPHPPYRDNRCGSCHNPDSGQLFQSR